MNIQLIQPGNKTLNLQMVKDKNNNPNDLVKIHHETRLQEVYYVPLKVSFFFLV